ncbi:hypothetical protein BQ8769_88 [Escherichia coli]|uniref:Uncharacterized protein n=1 Tax=Escherichia coli TaxID=562 RepID=A0A1W1EMC8_ECOLX|nr:hypothetical protein BQ8769_88 [Escherichia coli]
MITGVWKYRGKSKGRLEITDQEQQLTIAIIISIIFFVLIYHFIFIDKIIFWLLI